MKRKLKLFLLALAVYSVCLQTACPVSKKTITENVDEAVKQVYYAKGRVRAADDAVLELYKARLISLELKDEIGRASLIVYDGIEFANNQIKAILRDMDGGIITPKSAYEQIKQIFKDEVLIKINRFLVKFDLLSQDTSDKWLPIIQAIRDVLFETIDILKIKDVTVPKVQGV